MHADHRSAGDQHARSAFGADAARLHAGRNDRAPAPPAADPAVAGVVAMPPIPIVSVIVPAYQAELTLSSTLATARAQTLREIEIIVVDDGSTDRTAQQAAAAAAVDPRVRVLRQENTGVAAARNAGISAARGRWIAPLDADDIWHPTKLNRQLAAADGATYTPGMVYCWSRAVDGANGVLADHGRPTFRGDVLAPMLGSNFLYSASIPLLRRDVVERAGGFDTTLLRRGAQGAEDLALWLAVVECESAEVAPEFLVGYRIGSGSMSRDAARMHRSLNFVLDDFAQKHPETPSALLRLGRLNADMYAASLALGNGHRKEFLSRVATGLRRSPGETVRFLAVQLARRISLGAERATPPLFDELTPDQLYKIGDGDSLDALRRASARRAAGSWRMGEVASVPAGSGSFAKRLQP